jgi:hypothetical protein
MRKLTILRFPLAVQNGGGRFRSHMASEGPNESNNVCAIRAVGLTILLATTLTTLNRHNHFDKPLAARHAETR